MKKICYNCGQLFETDNDKICLCEECKEKYERKRKEPKIIMTGQPVKLFAVELVLFFGVAIFLVSLAVYNLLRMVI